MKHLILIALSMFAINTWAAQDLGQEMDELGANKALMMKARAIDPDNKVRIVQNRLVDLNYRLEISLDYGAYAAGNDPYVNTSMLGGQLDFHINPRWSIGARYTGYQNSLNSEGKNVMNDAQQRIANGEMGVRVPGYSWAKDSWLGVANWYPIYGKLNWFDAGVTQFDVYVLGGAGAIDLAYTTSPMYTAGGGIALWLSKHFSTRLEARWQGYTDRVPTGGGDFDNRTLNETVISAGVGFLL